jgi:hypothetical protein
VETDAQNLALAKSLVGATTQVLALTTGVPLPGVDLVIEAVLNTVFEVQDEQVERLRGLDEKVQRLLDGAWKTGHLRLEEAALPNRSDDMRRDLLTGAANDFRDAAGFQETGSLSEAQVYLDLAMTQALLNDQVAARHYAEKGYRVPRRFMWVTTEASRPDDSEMSLRDVFVGGEHLSARRLLFDLGGGAYKESYPVLSLAWDRLGATSR